MKEWKPLLGPLSGPSAVTPCREPCFAGTEAMWRWAREPVAGLGALSFKLHLMARPPGSETGGQGEARARGRELGEMPPRGRGWASPGRTGVPREGSPLMLWGP